MNENNQKKKTKGDNEVREICKKLGIDANIFDSKKQDDDISMFKNIPTDEGK